MLLDAVVRTLVGSALLLAAIGKARTRSNFYNYISRVLKTSDGISQVVGLSVIVIEGVLGLAVAFDLAAPYPAVALAVFIVCASGFLAAQLVVGGTQKCNCWGAKRSVPGADDTAAIRALSTGEVVANMLRPTAYAVRNTLFCAAAAFMASADGEGTGGLVFVIGAPALVMALGSLVSVWREHRKLQLPVHPRYGELTSLWNGFSPSGLHRRGELNA